MILFTGVLTFVVQCILLLITKLRAASLCDTFKDRQKLWKKTKKTRKKKTQVRMRTYRTPVNNFSLINDSSVSWLSVKFQVKQFHRENLDVKKKNSSTSDINNDVKLQTITVCYSCFSYKFSVCYLDRGLFLNPSSYLTIYIYLYNSNIIHSLCFKLFL